MSGGSDVNFPEQSAEEKANLAAQTRIAEQQLAIIQRQDREQQLFQPFLLAQAGLTPTFEETPFTEGMPGARPNEAFGSLQKQIDAINRLTTGTQRTESVPDPNFRAGPGNTVPQQITRTVGVPGRQLTTEEQTRLADLQAQLANTPAFLGPSGEATQRTLTGFTETPDTPEEIRRNEIARLQDERTLAALTGEGPLDPALERDLAIQRERVTEGLIGTFGADFLASTGGARTAADLDIAQAGIADQSRRREISLGEAFALSHDAARRQEQELNFSQLMRTNQSPLATAGALSGPAGIRQGIGSQLFNNRQFEFAAAQQQQQLENDRFGALIGGVAGIAGTAGGIGIAKYL
jgi:hypothetical protein